MTAGQVRQQTCTVTFKTHSLHSRAPPPILKISPHIRSVLHEAALGLGMIENRLKSRTFRILFSACKC
jgi:hypothetical protein